MLPETLDALEKCWITVNYVTGYKDTLRLPGIKSEFVEIEDLRPRMGDLFVDFASGESGVTYSFRCDERKISDQTLKKMADTFDTLLAEMVNEK